MSDEAEMKKLEREIRALNKEIEAENEKLEEIKNELEALEEDAEIASNGTTYFDMIIRNFVADFGEQGEEILREEFPEIAEKILSQKG